MTAREHNALGAMMLWVKQLYKQVVFIHCYAHKMNLDLNNSVNSIKE